MMKVSALAFFAIPVTVAVILWGIRLATNHDKFWHSEIDVLVAERNQLVLLQGDKRDQGRWHLLLLQWDKVILDTAKNKPLLSDLTKEELGQIEKVKADLAQASSK